MSLASYADQGKYTQEISKIVYSNAYKRLAHKSQIIIKPTRDHFRSRLIHTEEVNQIALSLGRELGLNLDLITAMVKAHDLGHTPFGHAGEIAIQLILERELPTLFKIKPPRSERKKEIFRRNIFHHSLNSARMLIKEKEFEDIPRVIIEGVLTHSWSPWKQKSNLTTPATYEGQVVAIADQLASINHDTEDILDGEPYTEYNRKRFVEEYVRSFRTKHSNSYKKLRNEIYSFVVDKSTECGYGRQKRVETLVNKITKDTNEMFKKNNISKKEQAKNFPICLCEEWSEFIDYYENFIRYLVQERVSWFITRDNMAGALISTVFHHLWPRVREEAAIGQLRLTIYPEEELVKTRYKEKTKYVKHFYNFFNEHYLGKDKEHTLYEKYLKRVGQTRITTWDINIRKYMYKKMKQAKENRLTCLVAVIDFISGLTDRYCLEIFDDVYQEFVIT